ncbi:hypothetical protein Q5O89_22005 [Peribacillus frigoritolerans]|nr:hypothetical protein [Peribacillus frigoritolerans]
MDGSYRNDSTYRTIDYDGVLISGNSIYDLFKDYSLISIIILIIGAIGQQFTKPRKK